MRTLACLLTLSLALFALAEGTDGGSRARSILARYLAAPHPDRPSKGDPYDPGADAEVNRAQQERLAILAELKAMPRQAVAAADRVLFKQANSKQRLEIVDALGDYIHTRECAELLHRVAQDVRQPKDEKAALYEELVRCSAVHGLRKMARCTDRSGGKRIQHRPDFKPAVSGLVPYLVAAANDKAERVRDSAVFALADTRDPAAVAELRNRLKDKSEKVRLYAACFLTEYQDASGLPEMRLALNRLREEDSRGDFKDYFGHFMQLEMLLASFERITGKSFGEIPLNPALASIHDGSQIERYTELLDIWQAWWDWEPDGKQEKNP